MTGYDDLQRKLKALSDGTANREVLMEVGQKVVDNAQQNLAERTKKKTNDLKRSIRVAAVSTNNQSIEVRAGGTSGVNYATWLEWGTGIYGEGPGATKQPITPKRAKFLRFPASTAAVRKSGNLTSAQQRKEAKKPGSSYVFVRSVKGIKPIYYMRDAVKDTAAEFKIAPAIVTTWNKA